uniref:Uncharacterized protein n=1 Tax=Setaria italica TaxID=4555 RepID=K3XM23_SETIT
MANGGACLRALPAPWFSWGRVQVQAAVGGGSVQQVAGWRRRSHGRQQADGGTGEDWVMRTAGGGIGSSALGHANGVHGWRGGQQREERGGVSHAGGGTPLTPPRRRPAGLRPPRTRTRHPRAAAAGAMPVPGQGTLAPAAGAPRRRAEALGGPAVITVAGRVQEARNAVGERAHGAALAARYEGVELHDVGGGQAVTRDGAAVGAGA